MFKICSKKGFENQRGDHLTNSVKHAICAKFANEA